MITASMRNSVSRTSMLPLSILARSRMSLIISNSTLPEVWMFLTYRFCLSSSEAIDSSTSLKPMMRVERRAQLVAHHGQKLAFQPVHFIQLHVESGPVRRPSSSDSSWRSQLFLDGGQVAQHAVERGCQILELVAGVDFGPQRDVAAADFVADVAQVLSAA